MSSWKCYFRVFDFASQWQFASAPRGAIFTCEERGSTRQKILQPPGNALRLHKKCSWQLAQQSKATAWEDASCVVQWRGLESFSGKTVQTPCLIEKKSPTDQICTL